MDVRKNAIDLSDEERDKFLEAIIRLKHRPAPGGPVGVSVYDQFVALHGAVFAVVTPGLPPGETVNYGHWDIGFCAWHRKYIREFEKALQAEVAGVTVPYWDWTDHVGVVNKLFTKDFLGSLRSGAPGPVMDGVFRNPVPAADRPGWWPTDPPGVEGYAIHPLLEDTFGTSLARGSVGSAWPPQAADITRLEQLVLQLPGTHPLWAFWAVLESGIEGIAPLTHDTAHNFIGGHMSQGFSPNDPTFWLHHSNVDRLWANWQARRLNDVPGSKPEDHYPPQHELSPFTLTEAPPGHRLDDEMWPWVEGAPGFDTASVDPQVKPFLPDFSTVPAVTVRDVLDTEAIDAEGYGYTPPGTV